MEGKEPDNIKLAKARKLLEKEEEKRRKKRKC
jgi:hypothetical protein